MNCKTAKQEVPKKSVRNSSNKNIPYKASDIANGMPIKNGIRVKGKKEIRGMTTHLRTTVNTTGHTSMTMVNQEIGLSESTFGPSLARYIQYMGKTEAQNIQMIHIMIRKTKFSVFIMG